MRPEYFIGNNLEIKAVVDEKEELVSERYEKFTFRLNPQEIEYRKEKMEDGKHISYFKLLSKFLLLVQYEDDPYFRLLVGM
jgi:hypothetical protein